MLKRLAANLKRFYKDETGAEPLEKILIIGLIILPLLAILIFFKNDFTEWVRGLWDTVRDEHEDDIHYN
jgi:Flp pilus assembly pilin Flp